MNIVGHAFVILLLTGYRLNHAPFEVLYYEIMGNFLIETYGYISHVLDKQFSPAHLPVPPH